MIVSCKELNLVPRAGMRLYHLTTGTYARAENDWGRIPERWCIDADDTTTKLLLFAEVCRRSGASAPSMPRNNIIDYLREPWQEPT